MIITGDPYALDGLAVGMGTLAEELAEAAGDLSAIEAETWRGPAADAFKAVMHQQPDRYVTASEAFSAAAAAIAAYAAALEDAQAASARAALLADTGLAGQEAADQQLATTMSANAMADLARAAAQATAVLRAAEQAAPQRPGLFGRLESDCWDDVVVSSVNVVIGFGKGTVAMAEGLYQAGSLYEAQSNPLVGLFDPGAQARADAELAAVGSDATEHPVTFAETMGKNMLDWDEWSQNPAQALGEMIPNILLGIATYSVGPAAEAGTEGAEGAYLLQTGDKGAETEPEFFGGRGTASGREFDPAAAGGPIHSLDASTAEINDEGVQAVAEHLGRFVFGGQLEAPEQGMLDRLWAAASGNLEPTQYDLNFYTHELDEAGRYAQLGYGQRDIASPDMYSVWNNVHTAALEDYGLTDADLYYPGVAP